MKNKLECQGLKYTALVLYFAISVCLLIYILNAVVYPLYYQAGAVTQKIKINFVSNFKKSFV